MITHWRDPHRIVAFNVILGCESVALSVVSGTGTKPIVCGFVQ